MTLWFVAVIVVLGLLLNLVVRRVIRRVDSEPAPPARPRMKPMYTADDVGRILEKWGRRAEPWAVPEMCQPIHPSLEKLASQYCEVNFDNYVFAFDRKAVSPYEANERFVVIGDLGEGSRALVRRDAADA